MTNNNEQLMADIDRFLADGGYESLSEWMRDSDYTVDGDGVWTDEHDAIVDPLVQIDAAMDVSGFYESV